MNTSSLFASAVISLLLSLHGYFRKSLTGSGAFCAFFIGVITLCQSSPFYPSALLSFYGSSVLFTKIADKIKSLRPPYKKKQSVRSHWQVLATAGPPTLLMVILASTSEFYHYSIVPYLSYFACCNGDTWASEIGTSLQCIITAEENKGKENGNLLHLLILPVNVLTGKKAVPGTNGGISVIGTVASAVGGAFVAIVSSLFVDEPYRLQLLMIGALSGLIGSLIDSILGASLQITLIDTKSNRVIEEEREKSADSPVKNQRIVTQGRNLLSNEQVNLVSSVITSLLMTTLFYNNQKLF